ncbi:zinc finger protein 260-like [Cheilinus undulatus]|uniref:zinc finger protein 260-like n=1 Tax=Cheilinus undulatus TaxID=241271 RepID=UPI001BD5A70E|nr:zinc finger protein 260-like [Cheilinus undulatus]
MSVFQDRSDFPEEVQQVTVKEEVPPENQEVTKSLQIKEEPVELNINQKKDQLHGAEEDDIIKFTFSPTFVKSEDDEEEPQSSQLHQRQTEELKTDDGEDCGEPAAVGYSDPERDLHPKTEVKTEDFSEAETDDSADWEETTDHQSYSKPVKNKRRRTNKELHSCSECGKVFKHKGHLKDHMRIHTGEKPYVCSECGKRFNQQGNLNKHMNTHSKDKSFKCSECGKGFNQKRNLTKHIFVHTRKKPFSCALCRRGFGRKENLTRHMKTHSWEKPDHGVSQSLVSPPESSGGLPGHSLGQSKVLLHILPKTPPTPRILLLQVPAAQPSGPSDSLLLLKTPG